MQFPNAIHRIAFIQNIASSCGMWSTGGNIHLHHVNMIRVISGMVIKADGDILLNVRMCLCILVVRILHILF